MDHLVIGQEGLTVWGAFRQALREVALRRGVENPSEKTLRELRHFEARAQSLGEALERENGGPLDEDDFDRLDAAHTEARVRLMASLDMITAGRVTAPTAELLLTIRPAARAEILEELRQPKREALVARIVGKGADLEWATA